MSAPATTGRSEHLGGKTSAAPEGAGICGGRCRRKEKRRQPLSQPSAFPARSDQGVRLRFTEPKPGLSVSQRLSAGSPTGAWRRSEQLGDQAAARTTGGNTDAGAASAREPEGPPGRIPERNRPLPCGSQPVPCSGPDYSGPVGGPLLRTPDRLGTYTLAGR